MRACHTAEVVVTFFFCDDQRRLNIKETTTMIANQKRMMDFVDPNYVSKVRTRIPITYLIKSIKQKVYEHISGYCIFGDGKANDLSGIGMATG